MSRSQKTKADQSPRLKETKDEKLDSASNPGLAPRQGSKFFVLYDKGNNWAH